MADINLIRKENTDGNFFVDSSCIDCDTCRWMAPNIFVELNGQAAVYQQPENSIQERNAFEALLSCPTASIGIKNKKTEINNVQNNFPLLISENVFHCGYHSRKSFGAASYFIQREEGNILIDSPRFVKPLVENMEKMEGVRYMFLTHIDDVAEHEKFQNHFNCKRIIHEDDIVSSLGEIEIRLKGSENYCLAPDLIIIPVPGHTKGHTVLLYKNKYLFTGDHLAWSERLKHLYAFRGACWYSWKELITSMEKLSGYSFEWVLPGHGRRFFGTYDEIKAQIEICLEWMKTK